MFIILKPFLRITEQLSNSITLGHYSHYRLKIKGDVQENLNQYHKLKNGIELSKEEFVELIASSPFFSRLSTLEMIDIYNDRCEFSTSRQLSFYSLFTNRPNELLIKIKSLIINIIGCGGLGSRICIELAASGFRNFNLIDDDLLDESNLERMFWFSTTDVGQFKTHITKDFLQNRYKEIQIKTFEKRYNEIIEEFEENSISIFSADDDNGFFISGNKNKLLTQRGTSIFCGYSESLAFAGPFYNSFEELFFSVNGKPKAESLIPPSIGYINSLITGVVINDIFLFITNKQPLTQGRKWIYNVLTGQYILTNVE